MRMVHYFTVGALVLIPALFWTMLSGILGGGERHLWVGLFSAVLAVAVHTLVILFMIVTGRVLREAMRARPLGPQFLGELNQFFARKQAYPLAVLAAFATVVAGVLGFSQRGFGISPAWHMLIGVAAVLLNLWALQEELRVLRQNQALLDRAAAELDALDERLAASGVLPEAEPPYDAAAWARWGRIVAVSAWLPYLYWGLIDKRGDFAKVSVHPWVELSLLGLLVWWLAHRERRAESRAG
jgi:hypothetical protein